MRGVPADRRVPARAVKGAERRRGPLTARSGSHAGWRFRSSGRMDPTTHSWVVEPRA
jgi:hypothetical protein